MSNRGIKCVWKSALLSVLASFVIFLSSGCSSVEQGINRTTNKSVQVNVDLPNGGDLIEIDSYESADEYLESLIKKEISQQLGLVPLAIAPT